MYYIISTWSTCLHTCPDVIGGALSLICIIICLMYVQQTDNVVEVLPIIDAFYGGVLGIVAEKLP